MLQDGNKDVAYWFDLVDEEKKNKASNAKVSKHQQTKLQVQVKPALTTRKIKPFFSRKV